MAGSPPSDRLPPGVEREYVDRARGGDQEALGLLYDAYLPRLYRYCLTRVGNETDAEDLAEEIFLKVLTAIDGFQWRSGSQAGAASRRESRSEPDAGSGAGYSGDAAGDGTGDRAEGEAERTERVPFGAWLFRIAHNHVVSFHRRSASRGVTAELDEEIRDHSRGPAELTETKLTIEEVFVAVRELPEAQREVILLRFASGLSIAETAAALGKHETNVKVLQHKGVQRLKRLLAGVEDQGRRAVERFESR